MEHGENVSKNSIMKRISIIIGYRRKPKTVVGSLIRKNQNDDLDFRFKNCLYSLLSQTLPKQDYEIIIVDYGNQYPVEKKVKAVDSDIRVIYTHEFGRFNEARAKNIGIKYAGSDLILSTNADIIFKNNFLKTALDEIKAQKYAIGLCQRYDIPNRVLRKHNFSPINFDEIVKNPEVKLVDRCAVGDCQILDKSLLFKIRGFDEDFEGWGFVDEDLLYRVRMLNLKEIWLEGKTSIAHQNHPFNRKRRIKDTKRHNELLIKKYKENRLGVIRNSGHNWGGVK